MRLLFCLLLFVMPQTVAAGQSADTPDFRIQIFGDIAADFSTRVQSYVQLRSVLEKGLPPLEVTDRPAEIRRAERALARRIRKARATAKEGDIFTAPISLEFRKALLAQMNADTWAAIAADNPGAFTMRINSTYPESKPLSTVPPNVLAVLPILPEGLQYRFVGRHLILFDTRARVVLDRIPAAISVRRNESANR